MAEGQAAAGTKRGCTWDSETCFVLVALGAGFGRGSVTLSPAPWAPRPSREGHHRGRPSASAPSGAGSVAPSLTLIIYSRHDGVACIPGTSPALLRPPEVLTWQLTLPQPHCSKGGRFGGTRGMLTAICSFSCSQV